MYILSLWLPMGVCGVPVASFGATLGSLGSLWGDFGVPCAPLGVTLGSLWPSFGVPLATRASSGPGLGQGRFGWVQGVTKFTI